MAALFTILAIGTIYIMLHQVYLYDYRPRAIDKGVDATNLGYIDLAWTIFPMIAMLAYGWSLVAEGRQQSSRGGLI